eukprot:3611199-Prymnesium_polylepis.2
MFFFVAVAGVFEVGQAYRLMLTLFFVSLVCLNSGLDFLHLILVCTLGIASFALAEIVLFLANDSTIEVDELPIFVILAITLSITSLWGARRTNRFQRQLFLQSESLGLGLDAERTEITDVGCRARQRLCFTRT